MPRGSRDNTRAQVRAQVDLRLQGRDIEEAQVGRRLKVREKKEEEGGR